MSRRILHIIDALGRTGLANQLVLLAEGLAQRDFDVHVAALDRGGSLAEGLAEHGMATTVLGRRWGFDPIAFARLRRLVARLEPQIIHTWNLDAGLYGRAVLAWANRRRLRFRRRSGRWGPVPDEPPAPPRLVVGQYRIDPWRTGLEQFADRRLAPHAQRYVTNSKTVGDWCLRQKSPERFTVLPSGVPPARTSDVARDQLLRELRLPHDARLVGVVGSLVPEKRVKELIWAADLLRVLHDNLRVLVIGDGPQRPQLVRFARLASDLDHIQFLGERDDLWRIMPHLDVLWNDSDNRAVSIAMLEAMAAGVPVIAADTPINREVVAHNHTGYLIPPAARAARARLTRQIFNDPALAARLSLAAKQGVAADFLLEQMVDRHVETYLQLSHGCGSSAGRVGL